MKHNVSLYGWRGFEGNLEIATFGHVKGIDGNVNDKILTDRRTCPVSCLSHVSF